MWCFYIFPHTVRIWRFTTSLSDVALFVEIGSIAGTDELPWYSAWRYLPFSAPPPSTQQPQLLLCCNKLSNKLYIMVPTCGNITVPSTIQPLHRLAPAVLAKMHFSIVHPPQPWQSMFGFAYSISGEYSWLHILKILLGDAIVCWRACVVWRGNRSVMGACIMLLLTTFGTHLRVLLASNYWYLIWIYSSRNRGY